MLSCTLLTGVSRVQAEVEPKVGEIVKDVTELKELYSSIIPVGSKAPHFAIKDKDGEMWDSKDFIGKEVTLIYFWSAFCPYCKESLPKINEIADKFKARGLKTIAINLDGIDFERAINNFIREYEVTLPVPLDELTTKNKYFNAADPYGVNKTPSVFLINRAGEVIYTAEIELDYEMIEKEVEKGTSKLKKKIIIVLIAVAGILFIAFVLYLMFTKSYAKKDDADEDEDELTA